MTTPNPAPVKIPICWRCGQPATNSDERGEFTGQHMDADECERAREAVDEQRCKAKAAEADRLASENRRLSIAMAEQTARHLEVVREISGRAERAEAAERTASDAFEYQCDALRVAVDAQNEWKAKAREHEAAMAELRQHREMDAAREAGYKAHQENTEQYKNAYSVYGPDEHKGRAWDTGWCLSAGNAARRELTQAQREAREAAELVETWKANDAEYERMYHQAKADLLDAERKIKDAREEIEGLNEKHNALKLDIVHAIGSHGNGSIEDALRFAADLTRKLELAEAGASAMREQAIRPSMEAEGPSYRCLLCSHYANEIYNLVHAHDCALASDSGRSILDRMAAKDAELAELKKRVPDEPFDKRCADALADEVAALVKGRVIDSRSPAADALLDYRDPPSTPRADRLAVVDAELEAMRAANSTKLRALLAARAELHACAETFSVRQQRADWIRLAAAARAISDTLSSADIAQANELEAMRELKEAAINALGWVWCAVDGGCNGCDACTFRALVQPMADARCGRAVSRDQGGDGERK